MLLIFIRIKRTFLLSSFDLILNLATNKQKRNETIKRMNEQRKNERTENERTESERTENERTKEWKNDWNERARLQTYAVLVRSSIIITSKLFNDWWDKIINIKSIKLINNSFNEKDQRKKKTSESLSLSFNVEKCRKWCIDIRYNTAMSSDSAYFIQRRAYQILEFDESFVDSWRKWWRCWFCINWFHQSQNQSEWTIARFVVYLINIVAFTSHSLIVFSLLRILRICENEFSLNIVCSSSNIADKMLSRVFLFFEFDRQWRDDYEIDQNFRRSWQTICIQTKSEW